MTELSDINLDFLPADRKGIYIVGGTVRDLMLDRQPADIDLALEGETNRIAAAIAEKCKGRVIDLGNKGFALLRVASPSITVDLTPLAGQTIEDNLRQRDFTINAMAYDVESGRLVDCTGGRRDLQKKTIRMVSDSVFSKDPARLVRAYRLAAAFQFRITSDTHAAIGRSRHLTGTVAGERIWTELLKLFDTPASAATVRDMAADGLLTSIYPELEPAVGCRQNVFHQFDVFEHSLRTYERLETLLAEAETRFAALVPARELAGLVANGALLKYAALLHDAGKPATRTVDACGRVRFSGHAGRGAAIADRISRRLRLSNWQRETAVAVIRNHIRPLFLFRAVQNGTLPQRGMIRFFNHCKALTLPIVVHTMADILAKRKALQQRDESFIAFCDRLMANYADFRHRQSQGQPLINGHDLIKVFGLFPAPRFKGILRRVDERRLCGELSTRQEALEWVKNHLASRRGKDGQRT